jgi:isopentenyl diphosphate isomerase/L-lactate dehydrogenase-like FMN-dependent dehydrogenase
MILSVLEMRDRARRRLPRFIFDFIDGGAAEEEAVRANRASFEACRMMPRVLTGNHGRILSTTLLGQTFDAPFGVTPMGIGNVAWPGTDTALITAARAANIPYGLSMMGSSTVEAIAGIGPKHTWFQIYLSQYTDITDDLITRAEAAGVETLIITVDANFPSRRWRDARNRFGMPFRFLPNIVRDLALHPSWALATLKAGRPRLAGLESYEAASAGGVTVAGFQVAMAQAPLEWSTFERVRRRWPHKLLVKGILHPEDARRVKQLGGDGVIVSNHGGRQLSSAVTSFEMLPLIRREVGPDFAVLIDSGVRSGEDIAKALAAGANFVLLGRPFLYASAALGSAEGPAAIIDLLRRQLDDTMAQLGCMTIDDLTPDILRGPGSTGYTNA